jgi:hypothetical protein
MKRDAWLLRTGRRRRENRRVLTVDATLLSRLALAWHVLCLLRSMDNGAMIMSSSLLGTLYGLRRLYNF